jgi:hypothetical protein
MPSYDNWLCEPYEDLYNREEAPEDEDDSEPDEERFDDATDGPAADRVADRHFGRLLDR